MRSKIALAAALAAATLTTPLHAAIVQGTIRSEVLFGADDDNTDNPFIQPEGVVANQSLNNADVIIGKAGDDVLIGLLGSDTMLGGPGSDILVGGTEQTSQPNSDVQLGELGNDVAIWAGGDGSDHFDGGLGEDALVFGTIDKVDGIPIISPSSGRHRVTGVPTANVTGQGGFCRLERVDDAALRGYDFLVRFFQRTTGNLLVTVRTKDVEQVFCTSEAGGAITFADLRQADPVFVEVDLDGVRELNPIVAQSIR
jgi:Ca2+-binding RTX toxin-like protein